MGPITVCCEFGSTNVIIFFISAKEICAISIFFIFAFMKKNWVFIICATLILWSCGGNRSHFSQKDIEIINSGDPDDLLYIYQITNPSDSVVLRAKSENIYIKDINSNYYKILTQRMLKTVQDSTVGGVGIAAPQIGINKRIIIVQRFDKPGEPFEIYPNLQIVRYFGKKRDGREGCLSVPNFSDKVLRSDSITIEYLNPTTLSTHKEEIGGFTSVIFQHEADHLQGIIYTDYAK